MNSALKSSVNIFLSRLSNAGAIYLLFVVIGYINNNVLGEFNVYLSFIGIFDGLAVITLIYFQNEASRIKKHTLLFAKGLQIAILLGSCVTILSSSVVYFQFNNSPLFIPMLLTTLTYPILSSVAFVSYYLEGINKANIVSQMHLIASFLQVLSFFILLKLGLYVAWVAFIAFFVKDIITLLGLLIRSKESAVLTKNILSKQDIYRLLKNGLPMSLGATITRYASALVVIAISLFGVASNNLYAVILQITAILLLPSISISQSLSICYSASANKTKEVSDCIKLNILICWTDIGFNFFIFT